MVLFKVNQIKRSFTNTKNNYIIKKRKGFDMMQDYQITIHDVFINVYGLSPTDKVVARLYELMPDDIKHLGKRWGWNDTEVKDKTHTWLLEKSKIL